MPSTFRLFIIGLIILCLSLTNVHSQTLPTTSPDENVLLQDLLALRVDQQDEISLHLQRNSQAVTKRLWQLLVEQGAIANKKAEFDRAIFLYEAAKQVGIFLKDQTLEALALYNLGLIHTNKLEIDAAINDYLQCKDLLETTNSYGHLVYVLADLGALYLYQQDYEKAKKFSEESLTVAANLPATQASAIARSDGAAIALTNLGAIYKWEGDYQRAINYLQRALSNYQRLKEVNLASDRDVADVQAEMGRVYRIIGDYRQSLFYFNQAMEGGRRAADNVFLADVMNSVGILYTDQRDFPKAIAFFTQSKDLHAAANDDLQVA